MVVKMKIFKDDFDVDVNPEVARWIIDISGFTLEELSEKTKIGKEKLEKWSAGEIKLKFSEIEKISRIIKRPLTIFLLPSPPKEKKLPEDLRTLPQKKLGFEPKTMSLLYRAREIQSLTKEMGENINYDLSPKIPFIKDLLEAPSKQLGRKYREEFGLTIDLQSRLESPKDLFQLLKEKIEEKNILILQLPIPVRNARGFALADEAPFTIVVSTEDDLKARNFTLLHEFAHLLLRISVIDSPLNSLYYSLESKKYKIEEWCNDFASEFLFPEEFLLKIYRKYGSKITKSTVLEDISKRYKVSKEMIIYKLKKLGIIPKEVYMRYKERFEKRTIFYRIKERPSHIEIKVNQLGKLFIRLVIRNQESGAITYSDALDYLRIKSKAYEKLASKVW